MTGTTSLRSWNRSEGAWEPVESAEGELLVADSWLVADGRRVRGWDLHMERFAAASVANGLERSELEAPIATLAEQMPKRGELFPRLELRSGDPSRIYFRLRPSPQRWEAAAVWPTAEDPRVSPGIKGPDIERLMQLRAAARQHGADEAVIVSREEMAIEAAGCSILWWEGDSLARVSAGEPILDGVTRRLLAGIAGRAGVELRESGLPLSEACEREVWLVNALIGIVPVTGWIGHCDRAPVDGERLSIWRRRLAELSVSIP